MDWILESKRVKIKAFEKLCDIVEKANKGWKPDWNDFNQRKYYPYFEMRGGFSYYVTSCYFNTYVASALCFKSHELAEKIGKEYINLYEEYLTL